MDITYFTTGKSLSEALIFPSTNPQYELQVQYMKIPSSEHGQNMLCAKIVFYLQNNFCTQLVLPMFSKKKSFWQRFTLRLELMIYVKKSCLHIYISSIKITHMFLNSQYDMKWSMDWEQSTFIIWPKLKTLRLSLTWILAL